VLSISAEPPASVPATSHLRAVPAQQELESAEPLPPSDADLIAASRSGDAAAYATLYQRHVAAASSLARQLVRDQAEANDVVAESFAKVLDLLSRGGGPEGAFRPYLLTVVRRTAYDRHRAMRRQLVTDQLEAFDPGIPFADPAVARLERSMIARAFASLPERWQAVLWHTEIEGAKPAEVAAVLGLSANGVAALAYRAREGLRQAYLQMHLSGPVPRECRPVVAKLGAYVRGGLTKRDAAVVAGHLDQCAYCQEVFAELGDVNTALRGIVAPLILGPAAAAYLSSIAANGTAAAATGGASGWAAARLAWFRHAPKQVQAATVAGVASVTVAGLAAAAMTLATHSGPAAGGAAGHRGLPAAAGAAPRNLVTSSRTAHHQRPAPGSSRSLPSSAAPASGSPLTSGPLPASGAPSASAAPPGATPPSATVAATTPPAASSAATAPPAAIVPGAPVTAASASTSAAPATAGSGSSRDIHLMTRINPVGVLRQGGIGMVAFTVMNTSSVTAAQLTAAVTLPAGVSYLAAGTLGLDILDPVGPGGWTCTPVSSGAACTHGPLKPGSSASTELQVVIASDAPVGPPPAISVDDAGHRVSARGTSGVTANGFPGSFGSGSSGTGSSGTGSSGTGSSGTGSSGVSGAPGSAAGSDVMPAGDINAGCGSSAASQIVVWRSYPPCRPSPHAKVSARRTTPKRHAKHRRKHRS
jgi:RNA polymerase sigma factor (sigma-70 family)